MPWADFLLMSGAAACLAFILVVLVWLVHRNDRKPEPGHFGPVISPRAPGGQQER